MEKNDVKHVNSKISEKFSIHFNPSMGFLWNLYKGKLIFCPNWTHMPADWCLLHTYYTVFFPCVGSYKFPLQKNLTISECNQSAAGAGGLGIIRGK